MKSSQSFFASGTLISKAFRQIATADIPSPSPSPFVSLLLCVIIHPSALIASEIVARPFIYLGKFDDSLWVWISVYFVKHAVTSSVNYLTLSCLQEHVGRDSHHVTSSLALTSGDRPFIIVTDQLHNSLDDEVERICSPNARIRPTETDLRPW